MSIKNKQRTTDTYYYRSCGAVTDASAAGALGPVLSTPTLPGMAASVPTGFGGGDGVNIGGSGGGGGGGGGGVGARGFTTHTMEEQATGAGGMPAAAAKPVPADGGGGGGGGGRARKGGKSARRFFVCPARRKRAKLYALLVNRPIPEDFEDARDLCYVGQVACLEAVLRLKDYNGIVASAGYCADILCVVCSHPLF